MSIPKRPLDFDSLKDLGLDDVSGGPLSIRPEPLLQRIPAITSGLLGLHNLARHDGDYLKGQRARIVFCRYPPQKNSRSLAASIELDFGIPNPKVTDITTQDLPSHTLHHIGCEGKGNQPVILVSQKPGELKEKLPVVAFHGDVCRQYDLATHHGGDKQPKGHVLARPLCLRDIELGNDLRGFKPLTQDTQRRMAFLIKYLTPGKPSEADPTKMGIDSGIDPPTISNLHHQLKLLHQHRDAIMTHVNGVNLKIQSPRILTLQENVDGNGGFLSAGVFLPDGRIKLVIAYANGKQNEVFVAEATGAEREKIQLTRMDLTLKE